MIGLGREQKKELLARIKDKFVLLEQRLKRNIEENERKQKEREQRKKKQGLSQSNLGKRQREDDDDEEDEDRGTGAVRKANDFKKQSFDKQTSQRTRR